jgi:hypothetical protein
MEEDNIKVTLSEPVPTRVLLEEDLGALETLSDLLVFYAKGQPGDPVHFNNVTRAAFLSIAQTLRDRVEDRSINYNGEKYIIMAKGRRKLALGLKRELDLYIGSDYGTNFIEACHFYFMLHSQGNKFNEKNLTYCGRTLFGLPSKDVSNYESGIKTIKDSYSVWFKICSQTYTLAPEKSREDAELQRKMLNRTFENLMTIKNTKPK